MGKFALDSATAEIPISSHAPLTQSGFPFLCMRVAFEASSLHKVQRANIQRRRPRAPPPKSYFVCSLFCFFPPFFPRPKPLVSNLSLSLCRCASVWNMLFYSVAGIRHCSCQQEGESVWQDFWSACQKTQSTSQSRFSGRRMKSRASLRVLGVFCNRRDTVIITNNYCMWVIVQMREDVICPQTVVSEA